ncbi:MAG TPA: PQQ-binding-like beta-propeller repeat protein [Bryobacteraceae bacterium]|nr:PQQ-binding-like beta-propeller repeat protein [Bryobacteraceae bacterium]
MTRHLVLLLISAAWLAPAAERFRDPSPPVLQKLEAATAPAPKPNSEVRFHAKPKPLPAGAVTHDWTSFLGPTHNAVSTETKLLRDWGKGGPKLVWEMKKGTGYASPAIAGDKLVYFHRQDNREKVECLHPESGEKYWDFSYPTQFEDRYGYNNGPRASPVIDGDRVYTYGAEGKLHCLRLQTGQVYWKRDIAKEFKVPQDFFGTASTPLIEAGMLILNVGAPGGPTVVALDKITGKMVWGAGEPWGPSYASPVAATVHGKRRLFVFAGGESQPPTGGLISLNPADGAIDFSYPFRSRSYESVNAASPVIAGNQVFISASYKTGGALLNILPDGKHSVAWTSPEIGTHFNTAVEKDGYLYAFDGRNEPDASLVCVELKTGKVMWRVNPEWEETFTIDGTERKQKLGTFRGTLLQVDGRFLCLGELGHLLWLDLSPKGYKELARTWLFAARETWSLPVLSRGLLYVSQHSRDLMRKETPRLLCYDLRANK